MESWWNVLGLDLQNFAGKSGFEWRISPADCPWRQGKCEVKIKKIKKLLFTTLKDERNTVSAEALQTCLFKIADLCNSVPISVNRCPDANGHFTVLRAKDLLQGRAKSDAPEMSGEGLKNNLLKRNL